MTFSQRDFWFYLFFPRSSLKLNFWSINLQVLPFEHPSLLEFLITLLGVCTLGIFWNHEMCMHAFLLSQCKVLISFQRNISAEKPFQAIQRQNNIFFIVLYFQNASDGCGIARLILSSALFTAPLALPSILCGVLKSYWINIYS